MEAGRPGVLPLSVIDTRPTALTRRPINPNFLLPIQSEFSIARLPDVEFFCQAARLPGVSMSPVEQKNPFTPIRHAGDVVLFDEFQVTFKVDEYMINYLSIFDWIVRLGFPESHDQYLEISEKARWSGEGLSSDCSILFIDSRGRPKMEARFREAFPIAVTPIDVDSRDVSTNFVTSTATFAYTSFSLLRVNRPENEPINSE